MSHDSNKARKPIFVGRDLNLHLQESVGLNTPFYEGLSQKKLRGLVTSGGSVVFPVGLSFPLSEGKDYTWRDVDLEGTVLSVVQEGQNIHCLVQLHDGGGVVPTVLRINDDDAAISGLEVELVFDGSGKPSLSTLSARPQDPNLREGTTPVQADESDTDEEDDDEYEDDSDDEEDSDDDSPYLD